MQAIQEDQPASQPAMFGRAGAVPFTELQLTAAKCLIDKSGKDTPPSTLCESLHSLNDWHRAHTFTRYRQNDAFPSSFNPGGGLDPITVPKRASILLDEMDWNIIPVSVAPLCLGSGMLIMPGSQLRLYNDIKLGMVLDVIGKVYVGTVYEEMNHDEDVGGRDEEQKDPMASSPWSSPWSSPVRNHKIR